MRPSLSEIATLKRADEQCAAVTQAEFHRWQRDPWDVRPVARPKALRVARLCRVADCGRRGSGLGLCHMHLMRLRRGTDIDGTSTRQRHFLARDHVRRTTGECE